jgi:two-component system, OmpR family, response regulator
VQILLVDDDTDAAGHIARGLRDAGYTVEHSADGQEGLKLASTTHFDLLILDRMLPHVDGLSIVSQLRQQGVKAPVLILSALGTVDNRIEGLRAGGDDYLVKPFALAELLARIEALARRASGDAQSVGVLRLADLELNLLARRATRAGREIELTAKEYQLLEFMMRRVGQVVTRTMLLESVWNLHFDPQTNLIDVHISRLRHAIDRGYDRPLLHTIRGAGYTLALQA